MFNIIAVKTAVLISVISVLASALLIVCFYYLGRKYNDPDRTRKLTKATSIALIGVLVVTWCLSGCFTKSETATEEAETSEAEAAAIAEAQKKFSGRFSFLENKDQEKTMTETRHEEMEELKKSNCSEAELIKELTEIDKRTNDVTLISGKGYVPANWAELDVDEYCQKGGALIDPDRGNCHLAMAHMVATAERCGNYEFNIPGWTVGKKGKAFAESENELAEMLANDPELYSSIYNELVSLNLEATEITGTFIVIDEVQGGKAVYLGEEAAGKFIELYFKNKAGKEKLFARFYKPCGNAAEKKSTVAKKTDPTPATPDLVETYTFKVVYDANGGENPPVDDIRTSTSSSPIKIDLSPNNPTQEGYLCLGWSAEKVDPSEWESATLIDEISVEANQTITVHAVWYQATYTLVYDANGGEFAKVVVKTETGTVTTVPTVKEVRLVGTETEKEVKLDAETPKRDGHIFMGWSPDKVTPTKWRSATLITEASVEADKSVTVSAVWKKKTSGGGGGGGGNDPVDNTGCDTVDVNKSSVAASSAGNYTENANKDAGKTGIDTNKNGVTDPGSGASTKTDSNGESKTPSGGIDISDEDF